jgi:hypothetical protein
MRLPDGVYNGRYNKEHALIRITDGVPCYVTFMGFLNSNGEPSSSFIYNQRGITTSNVELLLPAQQFNM